MSELSHTQSELVVTAVLSVRDQVHWQKTQTAKPFQTSKCTKKFTLHYICGMKRYHAVKENTECLALRKATPRCSAPTLHPVWDPTDNWLNIDVDFRAGRSISSCILWHNILQHCNTKISINFTLKWKQVQGCCSKSVILSLCSFKMWWQLQMVNVITEILAFIHAQGGGDGKVAVAYWLLWKGASLLAMLRCFFSLIPSSGWLKLSSRFSWNRFCEQSSVP